MSRQGVASCAPISIPSVPSHYCCVQRSVLCATYRPSSRVHQPTWGTFSYCISVRLLLFTRYLAICFYILTGCPAHQPIHVLNLYGLSCFAKHMRTYAAGLFCFTFSPTNHYDGTCGVTDLCDQHLSLFLRCFGAAKGSNCYNSDVLRTIPYRGYVAMIVVVVVVVVCCCVFSLVRYGMCVY